MDRRHFFKHLASGLVVAAAPELFLPKLVKPSWRISRPRPDLKIIIGLDARRFESAIIDYQRRWEEVIRESLRLRSLALARMVIRFKPLCAITRA